MAILPAGIKISFSEETHETINRLIDALENLRGELPQQEKGTDE